MTVEWADPPANSVTSRSRRHREIAEVLRAEPGRWARIREGLELGTAASYASALRAGAMAAYRPVGEWEATSAAGQVFVRYIGSGHKG